MASFAVVRCVQAMSATGQVPANTVDPRAGNRMRYRVVCQDEEESCVYPFEQLLTILRINFK